MNRQKDDGSPKGAGFYAANSKPRSIAFAIRHPIIANKIGEVIHGSTNISTNSTRFAINTGLPENTVRRGLQGGELINNMGSGINAFRHVLWQATIVTKYGKKYC